MSSRRERESQLPKAVLFDIGKVIVGVDVRRAAEPLGAAAGMSPAEIWRAIETDPRWPDWQEGRMTAQEWHEHLTGRFGVRLNLNEFCEMWNRALVRETIIEEGLFADMAKRFRMALLSNTDPIHVAYMEENFGFMRHFPAARRVYSCAVGVSKPSPAIYAKGIGACGVPAGEILYVDDVAEFVEAGRKAGLQGVQFAGAGELKEELRRRRLIE